MIRSVLTVLAGYAAMVGLTILTFALVAVLFPDLRQPAVPGTGAIVFILGCGMVAAVAGGWTTCRLAAARPGRHLLGLVAVVVVMGVVSLVAPPEEGGAQAPAWYAPALLIIGVVGATLGGQLRVLQLRASP